jgi:hypothetical protein
MSYCDFNPRLFKEFTSMKKKINPNMSDDWEIVPESYNTTSGFSLKSKKLNQQVADIELRRFLLFSKEQNLTIIGLKLQGNYIIGNDRSVYTQEMFEKWKAKYEQRTETIINPEDYIPGHKYKTPCGSELVYLGQKYISYLKQSEVKDKNFSIYTKPVKVHLIVAASAFDKDGNWGLRANSSYYNRATVGKLTQKFAKDLGEVLTQEQVNKYLEEFFELDNLLVYLSSDKPAKDAKLQLQEVIFTEKMFKSGYTPAKVFSKPGSDKLYTLYWSSSNLLSYIKPNSSGDLVCSTSHCAFNTEELKVTNFEELNSHRWTNNRDEFKVDKCYRIVLK